MKKLIDLQLFADEVAEQTENKPADNKEVSSNKEETKKPEVKYTDEDIDRIINRKVAELEKKRKKEVDEATKLAQMDAQQKAEYERDKLQKELDDLRKEKIANEMTKTARKMLQDEAINISDDLVSLLIGDTAESTKESVDKFIKLFKDSVQEAVKEALKGNAPKTGNSSTITKEEILAIKNPAERKKKIAENINLFNK